MSQRQTKGNRKTAKATSSQIALGGVFSGLSLVAMLLTAVVPFGSYAMAALAGLLLLPVAEENGRRIAWFTYVSVSLLALIIAPDKLAAVTFIGFFGYYPIIQPYFLLIKNRWLRIVAKCLFFNVVLLVGYVLSYYLFGLTEILEEMQTLFWVGLLANAVLPNIVFLTYDGAIDRTRMFYFIRLRRQLVRK